ncbi:magnesium-transporting ATPase (P-type) [Mucilaginibacter rubeus]
MPIDLIFVLISGASGFFPVFAGLYNYKLLDHILKIVFVFFIISSVFDPIMWILTQTGSKNNMPVIHVNVVVTLFFFTIIYCRLFLTLILKRITIIFSIITFTIMMVYDRNFYEYPSESNTALSILLIILSLIYFYQLLNPLTFINIEKQSLFWINAGVLFYSAVNIFLFMIFTQIPPEDQHNYYIINSISNIIANVLYSIGLLCKPQKTL